MAEGHLEVPRGCPWPWATVKFYTFYFFLSFTLYLALALPALLFFLIFYSLFGPCPARTALPLALPCKTDGQTDPALPPASPCPVWPPVFPNPTVRAESGFPNSTIRAGSTASIKMRNRRRMHRRTHTHVVIIYRITLVWTRCIMHPSVLPHPCPPSPL